MTAGPTSEEVTPRARLAARAAAILRRRCIVPEQLTTTEWADRYRRLPESSTAPGPFRSSVAPYTRRWMDLGADPGTEMMVMCWAAQTLKSTVIENIIGYRLCRMPSPIILVRPHQKDAEDWSKERFHAMVRVTPQLRERYRPQASTLRFRRFDGAFLWIASAQSEADLSSWSAPVVIVDEADRMHPLPEGNPVEIVARRMGAADVGTMIVSSTPGQEEESTIWPLLLAGTHELLYLPCPHCGTWQPLVWRRKVPGGAEEYCLRWADATRTRAVYVCEEGCLIEESAKPEMLAVGDWRPTNPEGTYPSSHLNGLYSPFAKTGWTPLLAKWETTHTKPKDLQVFVNTVLAEPWADADNRITADTLREDARLEPLERGRVPAGVGVLTAGVDVQDNRLELRVWGWGAGLESWLVEKVILPGDTAHDPVDPESVWAALDDALAGTWAHESGRPVRLSAAMVDTGYRTTQVYRFCDPRRRRPRANRWILAAKGKGGERALLSKPTLQTKRRIPLYTIGTDAAKDEFLRSQIYEPHHGPGFVHLPRWAGDDDELDQLVAEERKRRYVKGQVLREWRKKKESLPNEALDCRVLARAALEALGPRVIARLGILAEQLAEPLVEETPPVPERRRPAAVVAAGRTRGNWVTRPLG